MRKYYIIFLKLAEKSDLHFPHISNGDEVTGKICLTRLILHQMSPSCQWWGGDREDSEKIVRAAEEQFLLREGEMKDKHKDYHYKIKNA